MLLSEERCIWREEDIPITSLNLTKQRKGLKYGGKGEKTQDEQMAQDLAFLPIVELIYMIKKIMF